MARKRRNTDDEKNADIGMVMTVSLFLILLTFFILLNSIAVIDEKRVKLSIGSLLGAFGSLSGGSSPFKTGDSIMPPSAPIEAQNFNINKLVVFLNRKQLMGEITVHPFTGGHILSIEEDALFYPNRAQLKPEAANLLDRLAAQLKTGDYPVDIVGHTDRVSADMKGFRSNWELTALMAVRVHGYLVDRCGDALRVTSYGVSNNSPITSGETPESRVQNRRIDIILKHQLPSYVKRIFQRKSSGMVNYKRFTFKIF